MPNKPVRQNAKYKEQQYRKRMATQARTGTFPAELDTPETDASPADGTSDVSTVRYTPTGNGSATAVATARPGSVATARPGTASARPGVTPRRPNTVAMPSAVRTARGRIATQMQQMNLEDEMAFIRSDIRRLLILAVGSFAILIVLAFLIH